MLSSVSSKSSHPLSSRSLKISPWSKPLSGENGSSSNWSATEINLWNAELRSSSLEAHSHNVSLAARSEDVIIYFRSLSDWLSPSLSLVVRLQNLFNNVFQELELRKKRNEWRDGSKRVKMCFSSTAPLGKFLSFQLSAQKRRRGKITVRD